MSDSDIKQLLENAIEERKFNWLELYGMALNPKTALLAGAAIGYGLGLDEGMKKINELVSTFGTQPAAESK